MIVNAGGERVIGGSGLDLGPLLPAFIGLGIVVVLAVVAAVAILSVRKHRAGEADDSATALPGWYPDPTNPSIQRYWNGTVWTKHAHPAAPEHPRPSA